MGPDPAAPSGLWPPRPSRPGPAIVGPSGLRAATTVPYLCHCFTAGAGPGAPPRSAYTANTRFLRSHPMPSAESQDMRAKVWAPAGPRCWARGAAAQPERSLARGDAENEAGPCPCCDPAASCGSVCLGFLTWPGDGQPRPAASPTPASASLSFTGGYRPALPSCGVPGRPLKARAGHTRPCFQKAPDRGQWGEIQLHKWQLFPKDTPDLLALGRGSNAGPQKWFRKTECGAHL